MMVSASGVQQGVDIERVLAFCPKVMTSEFKAMFGGKKLVTLFELMSGVGSMNARVTTAEDNISEITNQMSLNEKRIKLLEYKSIVAETRSRLTT